MLRSAQPAFVAEVEMTLFFSHSLVETVKNVLIAIPVYMIFEIISKFFSCLRRVLWRRRPPGIIYLFYFR